MPLFVTWIPYQRTVHIFVPRVLMLYISASIFMETMWNVAYAVVGLIGLFIVVVTVVCISVHIYHCCSRRRRKRSDIVGDTCSRPSASSTAVDCQYITLQTNDGTAVPTAPLNEPGNRQSVEHQPASNQSDVKPPSYDEVMGLHWIYCIKMHPGVTGHLADAPTRGLDISRTVHTLWMPAAVAVSVVITLICRHKTLHRSQHVLGAINMLG